MGFVLRKSVIQSRLFTKYFLLNQIITETIKYRLRKQLFVNRQLFRATASMSLVALRMSHLLENRWPFSRLSRYTHKHT